MTTNQGDDREQGVEFGPLADDLEDEEYPMDLETLLERYGDRELGLGDDTATLRTVLGSQGEVTYESADDVRQSIIGMVSDEAIGRKNYSDRGGSTIAEEGTDESA
ncbi:hypothetical protein C461_06314 [Halorubrum aidingense JCM 13560]|uniref:DUF2795 domain-containing protein n=1 Tax=Halorubrum aidingense JCM 13560 TaxID=1230454 RepID=M0PE73_9EURY|nr:hypothetical protein [Halorubrum aidingense]EMA68173.1 hypothetical protein C461_06314 [Halorubrum aidingense JCM 13560]